MGTFSWPPAGTATWPLTPARPSRVASARVAPTPAAVSVCRSRDPQKADAQRRCHQCDGDLACQVHVLHLPQRVPRMTRCIQCRCPQVRVANPAMPQKCALHICATVAGSCRSDRPASPGGRRRTAAGRRRPAEGGGPRPAVRRCHGPLARRAQRGPWAGWRRRRDLNPRWGCSPKPA